VLAEWSVEEWAFRFEEEGLKLCGLSSYDNVGWTARFGEKELTVRFGESE
jgi:hypothetical protein